MTFKSFVKVVSATALCVNMFSCSNSSSAIEQGTEQEQKETVGDVIVGDKVPLVHSLENMRKAQEYLLQKGTRTTRETLEATHYYLCFKPKSDEEYDSLVFGSDLEFFDYPLDREILGEGSEIATELPNTNGINWLYTVVPVNKDLPNVEYEILEEAYIVDAEEGTRQAAGYEELEDASYIVTGLETEEEQQTRGRKWTPSVKLRVWDNVKRVHRPVRNCQVRFRSGLIWYTGWTDNSGYRSSAKQIRRGCHYTVKWEYHNNKWDIRNGRVGQAFWNGPDQRSHWEPNIQGYERFISQIYLFAENYYRTFNEKILRRSICAMNSRGNFNSISRLNYDLFRYHPNGSERTSSGLYCATNIAMSHFQFKDNKSNKSYSLVLSELYAYLTYKVMDNYGYNFKQFDTNIKTSLVIDVYDRYNQSGVDDRVSGYTMSQILNSASFEWNGMNGQILTYDELDKFAANLKRYSNSTKGHIDNLFAAYPAIIK